MTTYEEEFYNIQPLLKLAVDFLLFGKKLIVEDEENFVKKGGNIIVGNHIGSYKDVASLFRIVKKPVFFIANKNIFNRDDFNKVTLKHLKRHLGKLGPILNFFINPLKQFIIKNISSNIGKIGTIPVDMHYKKRLAINKCQEYVKNGRTIIILQGRGRVHSEYPNPYVYPFRRGPSIIAYNTYMETGKAIPVTPIAFFGTHYAWIVPAKIRIRVGKPMYITDYLEDDMAASIEKFRKALEDKISGMIVDIIQNK